jgi:hypothetical protein
MEPNLWKLRAQAQFYAKLAYYILTATLFWASERQTDSYSLYEFFNFCGFFSPKVGAIM